MSFKIVVTNIGQGGGNSIDAISATLADIDGDIAIISEFRTGLNGMVLRANLDRMGLVYQIPCDTDPDQDTIILASRIPFITSPAEHMPYRYRHQFFQALLGKFQIIGAMFDGIGSNDPVMNGMVNTAEICNNESALFIGNFHTDLYAELDNDPSPYRDHQKMLKNCGLLDVRAIIGHQAGDNIDLSPNVHGCSKDYVMVSARLAHTVAACAINSCPDHGPVGRQEMLVFEIDSPTA